MNAKTKKPAARWPADKVERWPLVRLIPSARNSRTHTEKHVRQIARSIQEWGFTIPVLIDEQGGIIAGHGRVLAAQRLKFTEVPVMVATGWSDAQKRAYLIADNKIGEQGDWDRALLATELTELRDSDFNVGLLGFSDDELEAAVQSAIGTVGAGDGDQELAKPETPTSKRGDLWLLGPHRLLCGDSTNRENVLALLGGAKPNLMVTDPPYGVDYDPNWRNDKAVGLNNVTRGKVTNDDRADWTDAWKLFGGDVAYVWHGGLHAATVADSLKASDFEMHCQIIWDKKRMIIGRGNYHWEHEPCWYAVRKGKTANWAGDRKQTSIWRIVHQRSETGHGTQKPIECMLRPILNNSARGDGVYDPFVGSGTTIMAATQSERHAFAMEIDPGYVDVVVRRWQEFTEQPARLQGDGRTFAEVERARRAPSIVVDVPAKVMA